MHENCNANDCPVNARVDALEGRFDRFENDAKSFHEKIDGRVKDQETLSAVQKEKLESIDGKLDKIISWREEQDDKPNKFLDNLKNNAVWMVLAAVIGMVLGRFGL